MKKIILTIGPALFRNTRLKEIDHENYIYRINGAQVSPVDAGKYIEAIRSQLPHAEIMLDLPGNKIRTANLEKAIVLKPGQTFSLLTHQVNFADFHKYLKVGDRVLASDSTLQFTVSEVSQERITFSSQSIGKLFSNKGLHVRGIYHDIPFLFQKDRELIELANRSKISYLGLSFVRKVEDIKAAGRLIDDNITMVSKIETKAAVDNLNSILRQVDYILIDRGDLSADVGLSKIPSYQKFIIQKACFYNKKVFLSTQFFKNMVEYPVPTIAEIIDLYNTLNMGIYGIQLSEETSIGKYPRECLEVIHGLIKEIDEETM